MPQIKIQGIKKSFDQHHILRGVDYQVEPGESHVLFGTSGLLSAIPGVAGVHIMAPLQQPEVIAAVVEESGILQSRI